MKGWNLTDARILEIIHELMQEALKSQPQRYLPLPHLLSTINLAGRRYHIHPQKKMNSLSKYVNIHYGSFQTFLENFPCYEIQTRKGGTGKHKGEKEKTYVYFREEFTAPHDLALRFTRDVEWEIV